MTEDAASRTAAERSGESCNVSANFSKLNAGSISRSERRCGLSPAAVLAWACAASCRRMTQSARLYAYFDSITSRPCC